MDVKVTTTASGIWITHRFEPGKPSLATIDESANVKGHTLHIVTDKSARDSVKSRKQLVTDEQAIAAIKTDVIEASEFVRWL